MTRFYHSVNTRYNIHFNANEAYKETLRARVLSQEDNLSEMLYIFPDNSDSASMQSPGGDFTTTIDKTTKAIKLHSIKAKPKRDPKRRNDANYQAWLQQKEFTPFMDQVWLLLAKAEFHEANYLRAITTFMYITKIYSSNPDIVAECQLWISRAYTEMGWMYEAGNVLHKIELAGGAPESQKALYSAVKANYLIRNNEYLSAIPHLEYAIKKEKDKHQKLRMKYLLGQVYAATKDNVNADKAFASVQGMNTPYKYTFNAKLQQLELNPSKSKEEAISSLSKMAKSSKNKDYLDQLYYGIGNVYLQYSDTIKAIENYRKAIENSTRNGYDKTIAMITLGDLYFSQRQFIPAQPCYSDALSQLKKSDRNYPRVSLRSEVLDELVIHVKTVYEQDSLQHLAQLPEQERLNIINQKIEDVRKEEERKAKEEERQKQLDERSERISTWNDLEAATSREPIGNQNIQTAPTALQNSDASFYFYNPQAVEQGKIAFKKQWGNRKLEDDWRRRSKIGVSSISDDIHEEENNAIDSLKTETKRTELDDKPDSKDNSINSDIYSVDYYLQQLPLTPEAIKESDILIENALFNMGKIYKNKLEDMDLAIDAFSTNIKRFPQTPNLEEIYYQLLLIYMQLGDQNMLSIYRNKLLTEFPQGEYATPLSDPNFEWNFRHMPLLQDSLYTSAYNAYQIADVQTVRKNYQEIKNKYPFTDLMPKFALLNALSYAQSRDIKALGDNLTELTTKYPKADVTPLATEILEKIKDGKILLSDGSPVTGFEWSKAYMGDETLKGEDGQVLAFGDEAETEFLLLLMYKSNTIDRNELLYQVADYNFSNYVIQTFDLSFDTEPPYDILQIKGFSSFTQMRSYINKAFAEDGLMQKMDTSILVLPISVNNYTKILPKLGWEQYISFFTEQYQTQLPQLIAYWEDKNSRESIIEEIAESKEGITEVTPTTEQTDGIMQSDKIEVKSDKDKVKIEEQIKDQKKPVNEKEINMDDLLTKDQLEKAGKINDAIESVEEIINNPVDGIKNLFNKYKNKEHLTKEEKAALKEEQKQEKQRQKELKAIEKAKQDSINKEEKALKESLRKKEEATQDSIRTIEKEKQQQIKLEEKRKKDEAKAAAEAKENERKQKEQERKIKQREQEERLRQQESERKEKLKIREDKRKEKEKQQKERIRQREKERNEIEKAREIERKEKEKQAEKKRKEEAKNK
ncbi:hypothetical protein [Dysgonomonas sp. Marseille-P4677]|uniref:type IX secretion system periplasmic lipoprotein PorW/SprE n=1 Tax=Dysgonomonas sp. Marseille-P4677 TaxID=2364790 RepID=UPI001F37315C|nr:hypothetical protein [Dysgonomonas sp. Marseille-P4677]